MDIIGRAKKELAEYVAAQLGISEEEVFKNITYPPREELGDLSLALPSLIKRNINEKAKLLQEYKGELIERIEVAGIYLNARLNLRNLFVSIFSKLDDSYGLEKIEKPKRIVVEHTSANPIHPLHIGHLRNTILGDALARALKARGHSVNVRFYVNDTGRQVAVLIYGLKLLGFPDPEPNVKKDLWLGIIYAMTNVILEIRKLREELKKLSESEYREKVRELDELIVIANDLRNRNEVLFDKLADAINAKEEPEKEIGEIIKKYEEGNDELKGIIRKYISYALEGFSETLSKLNIRFDNFDYESDLLWENMVNEVLKALLSSSAKIPYKGVIALDLDSFLGDEARSKLRIPKGLKIPPLVLMRSDGTTLYTVRDIAYTIFKFNQFNADFVINVIAEEQYIPQIQLRGALELLGYSRFAENLLHYSYGMVNIQGLRMSGRLGKIITIDEIYEKLDNIVRNKLKEKGGNMENIDDIANAALRYAILSVSANKPLSFDLNRITSFEQNSGPYLQYTYARAANILAKSTENLSMDKVDFSDLVGDKRNILILIAKFPEVFKNAVDNLRLEDLVAFLRELSDIFNSWYDKERVLQEQDPRKRMLRLYIVKGVSVVLKNGLSVLGIRSLERM
ncbi:arginine--tRNA ligase [Saccharolobus islandicus]|uniref:Arginine--tRNA ligase n=2 Tax=Saccharolobus islandicus TaxID=43080 RepID=C3MVB6_SACI4|nr:arginine--tRNA ligase [Sulfolobus islandicus]ACP38111.1 arginyl-tRNA synthetase [Sulfolobus islandicus M.14.25]ACP55290.1 arginyl-tRNA synthetase [Sulfolobus islandicus M.16.27]